jgi:hypothetical protein
VQNTESMLHGDHAFNSRTSASFCVVLLTVAAS